MNLWRLEWLRLLRTRRGLVLVAVFLLAGFGGPLTARYLAALIGRAGPGITVILPPPVPADGIAAYLHNVQQLGVAAVVVVAAAALALDADPGRAAFYRTRVRHPARLLLPRYAVVSAAVLGSFLLGTLAAWYQTTVLIGPLPPGRMLTGILLQSLYLLFTTATVAVAAGLVRSVAAVIGAALSFLIALPAAGTWPPLHRWLPSSLADAFTGTSGLPAEAAVTTAAATGVLLWAAAALLARREL